VIKTYFFEIGEELLLALKGIIGRNTTTK